MARPWSSPTTCTSSAAAAICACATTWTSTGTAPAAVLGPLVGERYAFIAGSLGRSEALGLTDPAPDTYEAALQRRTTTSWSLIPAPEPASARTRTHPSAQQSRYFPLDEVTLDGADGVLHLNADD